jgi:hypothetical protein
MFLELNEKMFERVNYNGKFNVEIHKETLGKISRHNLDIGV